MAKKSARSDDRMVAVEEALSKTELFIEKNQKAITIVVAIIVVLVLGFFGYRKLYMNPLNQEAKEQMFMAQIYFGEDSLDKALYGDGNNLGFLDIIEEYGSTKTGNLANYYAGVIFMNKGQYEEAINFLDDFESDEQIVGPMALGLLGDAYMELQQPEKAVNYYLKAANAHVNKFVTPKFLLKAGWTYELLNEYDKALRTFERVKNEFPQSEEARDIDRYIDRAEIKSAT